MTLLCARNHGDVHNQWTRAGQARRARWTRQAPIGLQVSEISLLPFSPRQAFRKLISALAALPLLPGHQARNIWNDPAALANLLLRCLFPECVKYQP